jgi:hypothetical protein
MAILRKAGERPARVTGIARSEELLPHSTMSRPDLLSLLLARAVVFISGAFASTMAGAQVTSRTVDVDTSYVKDYSHLLTGRTFLSTKFNAFRIDPISEGKALLYRPNYRINMGIGVSYRKFTLNLGFAIPFVNRDDDRYGRTRYLDAQANLLSPERATNIFLQVFRGYHLSSHGQEELGWPDQGTELPYRGDLVEFNLGISTLRVYNSRRFSYRAAFNQDAWQCRSQGSWLFGGYALYYRLKADSSLVPTVLARRFDEQAALRKGDFGDIGPMGGYAYTFVLKQRWFATASFAMGAGLSVQHTLSDPLLEMSVTRPLTTWGPGWHLQMRGAIGYNSHRDQVSLSFNEERVSYLMTDQSLFRWHVGNIRFNVVHRFSERLPWFDRGFRWLKKKTPDMLKSGVP